MNPSLRSTRSFSFDQDLPDLSISVPEGVDSPLLAIVLLGLDN